jgi:hypothetical protein
MWSMKPKKLNTCWTIWHEFGHALGEHMPGREGYGLDEAHAWKFELEAVIAAVNDGTLVKWGHTKKSIEQYLDERVGWYRPIGPEQTKTRNEEVNPLVEQLKALLA